MRCVEFEFQNLVVLFFYVGWEFSHGYELCFCVCWEVGQEAVLFPECVGDRTGRPAL